MSLQRVGLQILGADGLGSGPTTITLNSTTQRRIAIVVQITESGTIETLSLRVNTGSAQLCRISLQTIDASGNPTGTYYGGSTQGTFTPATATTFTVTLGTPATAVSGDDVAVVLEWDSTLSSATFVLHGSTRLSPYVVFYDGSAWSATKTAVGPNIGFGYSGSITRATRGGFFITSNTYAITSSSSPDEQGNRFKLPFRCRVVGIQANLQLANLTTADLTAYLYDDAGSVLASKSRAAALQAATAAQNRDYWFNASVTLEKDTWYRKSIKATGAGTITVRDFQFSNTDFLRESWFGYNSYAISRAAGGAWTERTLMRNLMFLIVDEIDNAGGSSGQPRIIVPQFLDL